MKEIKFKEKWYHALLLLSVVITLIHNLIKANNDLMSISSIHTITTSLVLFLILFKVSFAKIGIKIWALFPIFGGGLLLVSQLLFIISNTVEKINVSVILIAGIQLILGGIIFKYCEENIIIVERKRTNKDILDDDL
ncbi:MAG: hypothetical protein AAF960_25265 [Bacteroidota bacterium]